MPFRLPKLQWKEGWFVYKTAWALLALVTFLPKADAVVLVASNVAYPNGIGNTGTTSFYFAVKGAGACAVQNLFPSSLATVDTTANTTGLQFTVQATGVLNTIANAAVTTANQINIRVAVGGAPTTFLGLLDGGSGYDGGDATRLNYATAANTVSFGIALQNLVVPSAANGYCGQFGNPACQPASGALPTSESLEIGLVQEGQDFNNANKDTMTVNVILADCPFGSAAAVPFNLPAFNYSVIPEDGRVRIVNNTTSPVDSVNPIQKTIVFGDNTTTTPSLTSPIIQDVSGGGSNQYFVSGLTNDTQYCFSIGYVNAAGFITTDANWSTSLFVPSFPYCATPSQIDGFLQRSTCFIASVAYENEWDGRLEILRQFRDQLLERTSVGRSFTEWYYSWSPGAAHWVLKNPGYRGMLKIALMPLVESARAALWLKNNMWAFVAFFLIATSYVVLVRTRRTA